MLYAGKGVVGMDGLVALYFDAEPAHMRMIGKAAGDIAHHVLNKGRPRKGVFSHELLIFALEQRIDGLRAGRLGDLDEILDPAEPAHPDRHAHVGPLAVRAFAADGL